MAKIKKLLFKTLKETYGNENLWTEVEGELKKFGQSLDTTCLDNPFQNLIIRFFNLYFLAKGLYTTTLENFKGVKGGDL